MAGAFSDISTKPMNILKYQNNPKIMALIHKMASKMGTVPGFSGAAAAAAAATAAANAAGATRAAGATPTSTPTPPQPQQDDVDLD